MYLKLLKTTTSECSNRKCKQNANIFGHKTKKKTTEYIVLFSNQKITFSLWQVKLLPIARRKKKISVLPFHQSALDGRLSQYTTNLLTLDCLHPASKYQFKVNNSNTTFWRFYCCHCLCIFLLIPVNQELVNYCFPVSKNVSKVNCCRAAKY